jgi:hypothetical protein
MALNLLGELPPLDAVAFPNGNEYPARRLDADGFKLWQEVQRHPTDQNVLALLQFCVPDATAEDWATLDESGVMVGAIVAHCMGKLKTVMALAKNGAAGAAPEASPPRRSSRPTKRTTSSPASPTPSAPTG